MNENNPGDNPEPDSSPESFKRLNKADEEGLPIDVRGILLENAKIQAKHEKEIVFERKSSRRLRDFLQLFIFGNAVFVLLMAILPNNFVVFLFALSGMVLFNSGLVWTLWVVMDRY